MGRKENETYLQYIKRVTELCFNKLISYTEWGDCVLGTENVYSEDNCRKGFYIVSKMLNKFDDEIVMNDKEIEKSLKDLRYELLKERKKLQTINLEYHANARHEARVELFDEQIIEAISRLKPIEPKIFNHSIPTDCTGVLFVTDAHYGSEFELKGLFGEVVNSYSPEIFKARMWNLLAQMKNERFDYDRLLICDLGDAIEGILRISSLSGLKTGVLDSAMEYAEFMATWLNEVANQLEIPIEYCLEGGNHDILRLLTSKVCFDEENIAKVIHKFIKVRLENNPNVKIDDYADVSYHNLYGMNVLTYHGDTKSLKEDMNFFENYYNIQIDILVGAHLHHKEQETLGLADLGDREIIRVPSIMGTNIYAKKIRKLARAGAMFMLLDENGKALEKTYFLN